MKLMTDLVSETLSGRYRLVARLAGGGMGEVYRGHDLLLDRTVAVKVLQRSLATEPDLVERFKAEARAAARLAHPNVVAVYDWGATDDLTYYMVMEYVSGSDLRDVLVMRSLLEPQTALEAMAAVCDALAAAHSSGLVHRDVKPENILIARDGKVKVADFGIAAVADADRTMTGSTILGTLRYLSPEQAQGHEATSLSDIWAAGAVLSELVTGRPPAQGGAGDVLRRRAREQIPPPSTIEPGLPVELDDIVMRACALDPLQRYPDAAGMAQALRTAALSSGVPHAPSIASVLDEITGEVTLSDAQPTSFDATGRAWRRKRARARLRRRVLLVAVLLALLAGGGAWGLDALMGPSEVTVPKLEGLTKALAVVEARDLGLRTRVVGSYSSFTVGPGKVIDQSPESGLLEEGDVVELSLSSGLPKMKVPEVTGMKLQVAEERMEARGLKVDRVAKAFSLQPASTVLKQDPAEGKLRWGGVVNLIVSKGPEPVAVPGVAGLTASKATRTLTDAGFTVSVTHAFSDTVSEGKVISSSPSEGSTAPQGSEIELVVSDGPEFKELEMPDVRNMSLDAARSRLQSLGLRVDVVQSCGSNGTTVVETDPTAGAVVRENTRVGLFVC